MGKLQKQAQQDRKKALANYGRIKQEDCWQKSLKKDRSNMPEDE